MSTAINELLELYEEYEREVQAINRELYARQALRQPKPIYLYDFMEWLKRKVSRCHV